MHELGIVNYVVKQIEKLAVENELTRVESVTLEFGEVSGVVPSYLVKYWDWYVKKEEHAKLLGESVLKYETLPAITWCDSCKGEYPTVQYGKICPYCGSGETWLLSGQEMNIKEIVAE